MNVTRARVVLEVTFDLPAMTDQQAEDAADEIVETLEGIGRGSILAAAVVDWEELPPSPLATEEAR